MNVRENNIEQLSFINQFLLKANSALDNFVVDDDILLFESSQSLVSDFFNQCLYKLTLKITFQFDFFAWINNEISQNFDEEYVFYRNDGDEKKIDLNHFQELNIHQYYFKLYIAVSDPSLKLKKRLVGMLLIEGMGQLDKFFQKQKITFNENEFWKSILNQFPIPSVCISSYEEILFFNEKFLEINYSTKECMALSDLQVVEINSVIYHVFKFEIVIENLSGIESNSFYSFFSEKNFLLLDNNTFTGKDNFSELGIISSSMAHELNNPIAGILAATETVMEDFPNNQETLLEIKKSANKCKGLVEMFLGLSKARQSNGLTNSLTTSLKQALGLLRFRMIEMCCFVDINIKESCHLIQKKNSLIFNESVMSIVFYLLLNECLTEFSRDMLLRNANPEQKINGIFTEIENGCLFKISFFNEIKSFTMLKNAKLINYFLDREKITFNIKCNEISFICVE